ncbi:MAG: aspartate-semialdehyde dehydrogenase [Acidobacteria bacterium]|nr:aspartate-semialdehyde dehydrogenase [Acidobacteriota bacterium]
MATRIEVGILGATGVVGQRLVSRLEHHPWFRVTWVAASDRSAGRRYAEVPWRLGAPRPSGTSELTVEASVPGHAPRLVFSALDAEPARDIEPAFAQAGHLVVSNTRTSRMDPDVPLLIPEVNPDHLAVLTAQRQQRGWTGGIVTNPNCSTIFLAMALAPLRRFDLTRVVVTTEQAVSGAGHPGVASLDIMGNVVPYIAGEEEKLESEPLKVLGCYREGRVVPHEAVISAQTTRVAVVDGHTGAASVALGEPTSVAEIVDAWRSFQGPDEVRKLPTAPSRPIVYLDAPDRPQPRLDVDAGDGMVVHIGRLRPCPALGYKFVFLGHNTIRGAAGAAILNGELLKAKGYL